MIRRSIVCGAALTLLTLSTARPIASVEQGAKAPDVSRFLGSWRGDVKANEKALRDGLLPPEHGLKISTTSDALVVTTTFRRAPITADTPWIEGDKLSYELEGSTSSDTLNGRPAANRLTTNGNALVLTVLQASWGRAGGAGAVPQLPLPPTGNVLQTMTMSVDGDRLKVEWMRAGFTAMLAYDRQK